MGNAIQNACLNFLFQWFDQPETTAELIIQQRMCSYYEVINLAQMLLISVLFFLSAWVEKYIQYIPFV